MLDKWSQKVLIIRRRGDREPKMADLIQFVNNETIIIPDLVLSEESVEQYVEKKPSYKKGKISTFATENEENPEVCIYCDEKQKLENCNTFMEKTLEERIKFLAKQKSFCGYLKPMTECHNAKTCTERLTCSSCKGNHPTPVDGYTPNKKSKTDWNQTVDVGGNLKNNFAGFSID